MLRWGIALIVIGAAIVAAVLFFCWDIIPSPQYAWATFNQNVIPGEFKVAKTTIFPPAGDPKEMAGKVVASLHAANEDDLTIVRSAKKPCGSRLIDCNGLSEAYVHTLAAEEFTRRAEAKANDQKERAQKTADASAEAARKNAEAQYISAQANQRTAEAAQKALFWTAFTGICTGLALFGAGVGFVIRMLRPIPP
jgi:hypothetical protein